MKVVNRSIDFRKMEFPMTCLWNGLRLPLIAVGRLWRHVRRERVVMLDPRLMSAHWRRDLGIDN
jgi:hypothetical protein